MQFFSGLNRGSKSGSSHAFAAGRSSAGKNKCKTLRERNLHHARTVSCDNRHSTHHPGQNVKWPGHNSSRKNSTRHSGQTVCRSCTLTLGFWGRTIKSSSVDQSTASQTAENWRRDLASHLLLSQLRSVVRHYGHRLPDLLGKAVEKNFLSIRRDIEEE